MTSMGDTGILYLVPTPIGNLLDMTFRAVEVLKSVDLIACEDTRTSAVLLQHYGIETRRTAYHLHNERKKSGDLVERLRRGQSIALISDAGTPSISDPGFLLVRSAIEHGIRVEALPGPSALVPALAASGLPTDRFVFEGFLPQRKGRQKRLELLALDDRTVVFYVSPHRILKELTEVATSFGPGRPAVLCREISKVHESFHRGTLGDLVSWAQSQERIRGELVLLVAGKSYSERRRRTDLTYDEGD